jgi:hypothetical protein
MNDQVILALSGRKGSGKNTIAKFIGRYFVTHHLKLGDLSDDLPPDSPDYDEFLDGIQRTHVFECSFADNLKEFCIQTLGIPHDSCYGSDQQKNAPTQYQWENTPDFLRWKFGGEKFVEDMIAAGAHPNDLMRLYHEVATRSACKPRLKSGPMTGRDIMQVFGTDLIRHTFGNVWAEATVRSIKRNGAPLAIITDNRFPNEIASVLKEPKGYIIRLTRSPFGFEDIHPSESALDNYDWEQDRHFVLDNSNMTVEEQDQAIIPILDAIFRST